MITQDQLVDLGPSIVFAVLLCYWLCNCVCVYLCTTQVPKGRSLFVWWTAATTTRAEWRLGSTGRGGPSVTDTSLTTMPLSCVGCSAMLRRTGQPVPMPLALGLTLHCFTVCIAGAQSSPFWIATNMVPYVISTSAQECCVQMVSWWYVFACVGSCL